MKHDQAPIWATCRRVMAACGLLTMLVSVGVVACTPQTENPTAQPEAAESTTPSSDEDSGALADQVGESFFFHGAFQNQFSEALFVVQEDENRGWGEILVLNQSDRAFQVPADTATPLWIYGTVATLTETELEDNEVPQAEWDNYAGQPFVVAERITLVPPPDELAENAEAFLNQHVTVYGKVEPVAAANTFILQDPQLFGNKGVILIQGANADLDQVVSSENAVVSGVLRPYILADLKQDYDLPWALDLQERLEADYQQSPVIVVDQALPVDN